MIRILFNHTFCKTRYSRTSYSNNTLMFHINQIIYNTFNYSSITFTFCITRSRYTYKYNIAIYNILYSTMFVFDIMCTNLVTQTLKPDSVCFTNYSQSNNSYLHVSSMYHLTVLAKPFFKLVECL